MGKEFEAQVISLLGQMNERLERIENKQSEHDARFDKLESKLHTVSEQTAINTELAYTVSQLAKQTQRNTFDINSIKDRLGN